MTVTEPVGPRPIPEESKHYLEVLRNALAYARANDYAGWDYVDGMSSKVWKSLPIDYKWANIAFQEVVKRSPPTVRRLLLVEQRRNYMGGALFAVANRNLHDLGMATEGHSDNRVDYLAEMTRLLDWLVESKKPGYSGFGVGHQHDIQDLQGFAEANTPDAVVTSYAVRALVRGACLDQTYPEVARTSADLLFEDLNYREFDDGTARITYSQNHPERYYTLNAGALGARLLVDLYDHFGTDRYRESARALLDYIVDRQQPVGGWKYRDPPSASHLSMDTHHNGFILECLQRYQEVTGERRYEDAIASSLWFHRTVLFDPDGAPNFDEQQSYPRDSHACAQGILVFSYAGEFEFARRILEWTLENLYDGDGRFYFRKTGLYTRRITLMRWSQAWMAYAISEYLIERTRARAKG